VLCYDRGMPWDRHARWAIALVLASAAAAGAAEKGDALTRARTLYNARQFAAAISASDEARQVPARADAADLVAARAFLERFRETAADEDLTNGRERLRRLDPQRLGPRERLEFMVGLGEALYFDGAFGAAAEVFDTVLARPDELGPQARDRVVDWWASAIDQDARPRAEIERQPMYQRVRERMIRELGAQPASAAAAYWLSASARGQGDWQTAWDAALAAWVRAPLAPDHGAALRSDIDNLVTLGIIPERAKALAQPADTLKSDWERFKDKWQK
jgi:hypothetical protein